ncbi:Microsomal glutathione S-transferase 3 [Orchesella cincta]|uniref:Glutathione S-transferase 3, mitochondrial n=1 Tax=Orchesella cincta TaxID=48709 RepID=A0A1D2N9T8_ORCCI|nr:Microsomal glutathione S-transferase 3 [Orchesella cincta]
MDFLFGGSALNAGNHAVALLLPKAYGFVVLVAVASSFLLVWMSFQVGKARKQFNVNYPTMYHPTNDKFNCYQRAHQNTLEGYTTFLLVLLIGGLEMPVFSALAGIVWIAGKVSYAQGYFTGDPKNRLRGSYAYIGLLALLFATVKFGVRLAMQ